MNMSLFWFLLNAKEICRGDFVQKQFCQEEKAAFPQDGKFCRIICRKVEDVYGIRNKSSIVFINII